MKTFACGEVVRDCPAVFSGPTFEDILRQVAEHARSAHNLESVPPEVIQRIRLACLHSEPDQVDLTETDELMSQGRGSGAERGRNAR